MSWRGVVKAVDRAGTTIMQKAGAIDKTVDKDFEEEERRYRVLEGKVQKLHKEAKGCLDSLRGAHAITLSTNMTGMTIAQQRIGEIIHQFYDDSAALAPVSIKFKDAANQLDEDVRAAMDEDYRTTVLEPLARFTAYFPCINEAIKRRHKKLLDYDAVRAKTEKEMGYAKGVYEKIHNTLMTDLPRLVDLRYPYIDPSFEALLKCQIGFARRGGDTMTQLVAGVDTRAHGGQIESALQHMRDLPITQRAQSLTQH